MTLLMLGTEEGDTTLLTLAAEEGDTTLLTLAAEGDMAPEEAGEKALWEVTSEELSTRALKMWCRYWALSPLRSTTASTMRAKSSEPSPWLKSS